MDLKGKNVVIFGASSGLGKALAELLSKKEAHLFLLSRNPMKANIPLAEKIQCDVTKRENVVTAFEIIDRKINQIDYVIYSVGRGLLKNLEETTEAEITDILDTDLKGAIFVNQEAYKRMLKNKSGHIVNILSTSGRKARAMESIYCAAKWGLRGFNDSLQIAAEKNNIRVTAIYPGGMKSENFWKIVPGKDISQYLEPSDVAQKIINMLEKAPDTKELLIERPAS